MTEEALGTAMENTHHTVSLDVAANGVCSMVGWFLRAGNCCWHKITALCSLATELYK